MDGLHLNDQYRCVDSTGALPGNMMNLIDPVWLAAQAASTGPVGNNTGGSPDADAGQVPADAYRCFAGDGGFKAMNHIE